MSTLQESKCTACRADAPRVTDEEIAELKPQIPDWQIVERDGIPRLERVFRLKNFVEALEFTNKVGALAGVGRTSSCYSHTVGQRHRYLVDA